jgi:hypothetical protein
LYAVLKVLKKLQKVDQEFMTKKQRKSNLYPVLSSLMKMFDILPEKILVQGSYVKTFSEIGATSAARS